MTKKSTTKSTKEPKKKTTTKTKTTKTTKATKPKSAPKTKRTSAKKAPAIAISHEPLMAMMQLINQARANSKASALEIDTQLQAVAQRHAEDMAQRGKLDHLSANGANFAQRLEQSGYGYQGCGENVAAGFPTANEVVATWLNEPADGGHRVNMLNPKYRRVGIGIAYQPAGYPYWVVDLADPAE